MTFRPTRQAIERAWHTIDVARVFTNNAPAIASACAEAAPTEIVVAAVDPGKQFGGVFLRPLAQLYETVTGQEPNGWYLIFSPGDTLAEIEWRCHKMAKYAEARYRLASRIASR
jgi:hypothetical protein